MNFKTTLFLAAVLAILVLGFIVLRQSPRSAETDIVSRPLPATDVAARDLITEKPDDVVKISVQKKGREAWVFEKETSDDVATQAVWRMTAPLEAKAVSWEVERFSRDLDRLQYEISYKPGEPGAVSAADAGLDPPEATVTLTDADGESVTVEIGRPASQNETYVRLAGSEEICVGKSNLRTLFKSEAVEYRDKQVWNFAPEHVTRVEIDDHSASGEPVAYVFVKDGTRWMMESPVTAKATDKVDEMVRAVSRLRVMQWESDTEGKLSVYGLDPPALVVRVTVEEPAPVVDEPEAEGDEDAEAEPEEKPADEVPPEPVVTVHELSVASNSPIGEDTKTYLRLGNETAVATIMKTMTDKFKPVMSEWREMRITTATVARATRIEITVEGESLALVRTGTNWSFASDSGPAEAPEVTELLEAIEDLEAVAFVEVEPDALASFGLGEPRAEVRLTIPGVEGVERITIGDYTDTTTKRMVYVRRNELASVAKVRTSDVQALLRSRSVYRDRTVFDLPGDRVNKIALSTDNRYTGERMRLTFEKDDDEWTMVEPIVAAVRTDRVDGLAHALADLRSTAILAEAGEASAFGLHAPAASVTVTYLPPIEYRIELPHPSKPETTEGETAEEKRAEKGEGGGPEPPRPVEVQPPPVSIELVATQHDGKFCAKRADRTTIYEIDRTVYDRFFEEFRKAEVMNFDDAKVSRFSIRKGDETHTFVKADDRWTYGAEPDLPLATTRVQNLLLQVTDLKTERYVTNTAGDLIPYGLASPSWEVAVTMDDGTELGLSVSDLMSDAMPDTGHYAIASGVDGVFLLTENALRRIEVDLDALEAR